MNCTKQNIHVWIKSIKMSWNTKKISNLHPDHYFQKQEIKKGSHIQYYREYSVYWYRPAAAMIQWLITRKWIYYSFKSINLLSYFLIKIVPVSLMWACSELLYFVLHCSKQKIWYKKQIFEESSWTQRNLFFCIFWQSDLSTNQQIYLQINW